MALITADWGKSPPPPPPPLLKVVRNNRNASFEDSIYLKSAGGVAVGAAVGETVIPMAPPVYPY